MQDGAGFSSSTQMSSPASTSEILYKRTVLISLIALGAVVVLNFRNAIGVTNYSSTSVSITFPDVNYTTSELTHNSTLERQTASIPDEFEEENIKGSLRSRVDINSGETAEGPDESPKLTTDIIIPKDIDAPRVALMFLSRGELHNEPVWKAFFEAASRLSFRVQPPNKPSPSFIHDKGKELFHQINAEFTRKLHQAENIQSIMACDNEPDYLAAEVPRLMKVERRNLDLISRQRLFSIYTHPSLGYTFPNTSIFHGTEVEGRINTAHSWGGFALINAEKRLLKAALRDEQNRKFILLSESCIPLHRPELVYLQLLSEEKSRMNACHPWGKNIMLNRWDGHMKTPYLSAANWRKSSQWFCLTRSHAELIAEETHVAGKFRKYCRGASRHHCVPDEHYIPTTLAVYGVDNETDCTGTVTAAVWPTSGRAHPVSFPGKNINSILFKKLRHSRACQVGTAQSSTRHVFEDEHIQDRCLFFNGSVTAATNLEDSDNWVLESGYMPLNYGCPMFARKFSRNTVKLTLKTALSCSGSGLGYWC